MFKVARGHWGTINGEVLKRDVKPLTVDDEELKGNEEALKGM